MTRVEEDTEDPEDTEDTADTADTGGAAAGTRHGDLRSVVAVIGPRSLLVLLGVVLVIHATSPSVQVTDSRLSVHVAHELLHEGDIGLSDLPPSAADELGPGAYDVVERDGELLPYFPYPPMMLLVPAVAAAEVAGIEVTELDLDPSETGIIEIPAAALVVATTAVVTALLAGLLVEGSGAHRRRVALLTASFLAFGTAAWSTASRAFWQQTPAMLLLALVLLELIRATRRPRSLAPAGALLALAFTMRPTLAVTAAVLVVWVLATRRERLPGLLAGSVPVVLAFVVLNLGFYGEWLPPYFDPSRLRDESVIPLGESLLIHLLSPGRGLLVFTPLFVLIPLSLRLARREARDPSLLVALAAAVPLHWLVVASYGSTAGAAYGSRFFTEMTPVLVVLLVPLVSAALRRRLGAATTRVAAVLAATSVVMAAVGAIPRSAFCWSATPEPVHLRTERVWDVSDPPFLRPARDLAEGRGVEAVLVGACDEDT